MGIIVTEQAIAAALSRFYTATGMDTLPGWTDREIDAMRAALETAAQHMILETEPLAELISEPAAPSVYEIWRDALLIAATAHGGIADEPRHVVEWAVAYRLALLQVPDTQEAHGGR